MAKNKVTQEKEVKAQKAEFTAKPKKLSKAGEWLKANPNGLEGYVDWRAVMK